VGEEARLMLGRTPGTITAIRPMRDGVIADYVITEKMLEYFINKVSGRIRVFHPELMICVPSGVTSVERRAVKEAALRAGAREAYLIEEPLAAAIGANLPISGPSGNMIIGIGGGTAEIAVISLGGIVVSKSVRAAGNRLDEAIANFVRKRYNLMDRRTHRGGREDPDRLRIADGSRADDGSAGPVTSSRACHAPSPSGATRSPRRWSRCSSRSCQP